jgi:hypothetical protein
MTTQQDIIFSNQTPVPQFYKPQSIPRKTGNVRTDQNVKKISRRLLLLKGLSPFLISCLLLPGLFTYWFITEEGLFRKSLLCFGFLFAEANLFYLDVALWRYYEGKRKIRIWIIELVCILLVVFLF